MFSKQIEFWTKDRARLLLRLITVVQLLAVVLTYIQDSRSNKSIRRGDFPSFYSAAVITASADYKSLYDLDYQRTIQNKYWPSLAGNIAPFVYPPPVAVLLSPLSLFSPTVAQLIFISAMFLFLILSSFFAAPFLSLSFTDLFCISILFAPLTSGVFSSQNTALSLLCYALILKNVNQNKNFRAGIYTGLWFFKPHFAFISLYFLGLSLKLKYLLGALIVLVSYYLLGLYKFGFLWPIKWLEFLNVYAKSEIKANAYQIISINGSFLPVSISLLISFIFVLFLSRKVLLKHISASNLVFLLGPVIVLFSPHTVYYDSALCLYAICAYLKPDSDRKYTFVFILLVIILYISSNRNLFSISPLFLIAPSALYYLWKKTIRN